MAFGTRLRELREAKGLTQSQLALAAGLSGGSVSNLEQGFRKTPSWETLQKLAGALGVGVEAFTEEAESDEKRERGRPRKPAPDAATAPAAPEPKLAKGKRGPKGGKPR